MEGNQKKTPSETLAAKIELALDFFGSCCLVFALCRSESWSTAEISTVNIDLTEHSDTWYGGSAACQNKAGGTAHFNKGEIIL